MFGSARAATPGYVGGTGRGAGWTRSQAGFREKVPDGVSQIGLSWHVSKMT
jgi:hypothetical protein